MSEQSHPGAGHAARIEVIGGQPVVLVGDRVFALPAMSMADIPMNAPTAPTMEQAKPNSRPPVFNGHDVLLGTSQASTRATSVSPLAGLDLQTLKSRQAVKKQELRTVEQTEVLQASHQSEAWRAGMIEKKRSLVVELDALRKQITAVENDSPPLTTLPNTYGQFVPASSAPMHGPMPHFQQPPPQAMFGFPSTAQYNPMMVYQPPFAPFPGFQNAEPVQVGPAPKKAPHSPGSIYRRSHAVEIKPPHEDTKKQTASTLDPKSPTYRPAQKSEANSSARPPTPSQSKQMPWNDQHMSKSETRERRELSHNPSLSSIDTTDFFPTNTHEHSSTRAAPTVAEGPKESPVVPTTPEKRWPASPWNEAHSGGSRNQEPTPKLASWPESFARQESSSALRERATGQKADLQTEAEPTVDRVVPRDFSVANDGLVRTTARDTASEENLPGPKLVQDLPSSYQEGYQAGYDHIGIPDSPEVLHGYIQGLLHFLADDSKKRQIRWGMTRELSAQTFEPRTPSLRSLVAGSMPLDPTAGAGNDASRHGSRENLRLSNGTSMGKPRFEGSYNNRGRLDDTSASFAPLQDVTQFQQLYGLNPKNLAQTINPPDRATPGPRHVVFASGENGTGIGNTGEGIPPQNNLRSNSTAPWQTFGRQIQNQGNDMHTPQQRFHPSIKEIGLSTPGSKTVSSMRLLANYGLSGLDGAMDDLAELINDERDEEPSTAPVRGPTKAAPPTKNEERTASCFKSPSNKDKGKHKLNATTTKEGGRPHDKTAAWQVSPPSSPRKSGEQSPAKAKLDHMTNKLWRGKRDDGRATSPDESKASRSEKWRQRFQALKRTEMEEIEEERRRR